jgi:CysZ protein
MKARTVNAGPWASFRQGFLVPWDGLSQMRRHPQLWKYGVAPIITNLLITGIVLLMLIVGVGFGIYWLHSAFPDGWGWLVLEVVSGIGLVLLALLGAFVTWLLLQGVLCDHFYSKLARQTELQLGVHPDQFSDVPFMVQVADAVRTVTKLVAVNIGLLALHLLPLIGSIAAIFGSLYFNSMILGGEFIAYPLDLRGMRRAEKRDFVRRNRFHTLGLGASVMLLILIPMVGAVLLTTAVTGSVLLYHRLHDGQTASSGVDLA